MQLFWKIWKTGIVTEALQAGDPAAVEIGRALEHRIGRLFGRALAWFVRRDRGRPQLANAPELLALWVQAYVDVLRPKLIQRNFQMKIVDKPERWRRLTEALAKHDVRWALTGADAALLTDPHLRAEQTELYAAPERFDEPDLLRELQVQLAINGNLQVIEPPAPVALQREADQPEFPVAPSVLVYAELRYLNNDQANEAAELLLPRVLDRAKA